MDRQQQIAEAQELRAAGLIYRDIAERMGLPSPKAAWKLVNADAVRAENLRRSPYKRAHQDRHRAACPDCGEPRGAGTACPSKAGGKCARCARADLRAKQQARDDRLVELWSRGLSLKEIAEEMDSTAPSIGVAISRMRKAGRPVPYRRASQKSSRVAA